MEPMTYQKSSKNPIEHATKPTLTNTRGAVGEIAPEKDFKDAQYGSELGVKTLTRYYTTYFIPKGIVFSAPEDARVFEAPTGNVVLYK